MDWLNEDVHEHEPSTSSLPCWKVAIVDDDEEIHKVTKLSLSNFQFEGRAIEFVSLYSGAEAKEYFEENDDVALLLLDVVMESDDAGLQVVNYLRNELNNSYTRIILRTGQPGKAPEHSIFEIYDIDGYKGKTDLNVNALKQVLYIALRSYRDLVKIQYYQKGLEAIINSISNMNQLENVLDLAKGILTQLKSIFNSEHTHFLIAGTQGYADGSTDKKWSITINDNDAIFIDNADSPENSSKFNDFSKRVLLAKQHIFEPEMYGYYYSRRNTQSVFILESTEKLSVTAEKLLQLFVTNLVIMVENLSRCKLNKGITHG
ncbi:DUF3369 domain-containing protein [Colwellia sp. TT2012]|uniref:DUF3369 domain-containing protein n=1 Tax=Colwellia sp. TT2012 TaxID=1720342 RepID=UPI00070B43A0|nr:DUF3369 domain-containing protein [Colwellia sp. TT2012]